MSRLKNKSGSGGDTITDMNATEKCVWDVLFSDSTY